MDWKTLLPATGEADKDFSHAREIRMRPGQPLWALFPEGPWTGKALLTPNDILLAAQALTGHGLAPRAKELTQGYLPLPGGHRLGVAGVMSNGGMREINSLCLRIAHEEKGCGAGVFPRIRGRHTLIIGPPGAGKTTLLRDLIRLCSLDGYQVGIADPRGEIAGCTGGAPQLDLGAGADVVTGMEKAAALTLLLRSMAPQVLAADELAGEKDAAAALDAMHAGITLLATLHGRSVQDALSRPGMAPLFAPGGFARALILIAPGERIQVEEIVP